MIFLQNKRRLMKKSVNLNKYGPAIFHHFPVTHNVKINHPICLPVSLRLWRQGGPENVLLYVFLCPF